MSARYSLSQRLLAEALGTGLLVTAVIGSGVMAGRLSGGNGALALLCNALATSAALVAIIATLAPISGAHLNPAITMMFAAEGSLRRREAAAYVAAQIIGGLCGAILAHLMFSLPAFQIGVAQRGGFGQWLSEIIATAGLAFLIWRGANGYASAIPALIGLYIGAAYWFTSSTSFSNPAVTIARSFTTSFAGIAPSHAPAFVLAQCAGAWIGWRTARALAPRES